MSESVFSFVVPIPVLAMRLFTACILGFLIGIDREYKQRPAGLRTHMLVSLAAAMFMIITIEMIAQFSADYQQTRLDPIRVVEAVTAGVAFLAAGTILQARGSVKGLTTGASMWLAGAVGVACGAGYLIVAVLGTALSLFILVPLRILEARLPKKEDGSDPRKPPDRRTG